MARKLGLDPLAERIFRYILLCPDGVVGVRDLMDWAGVSTKDLATALDSLTEQGLLMTTDFGAGFAVSPNDGSPEISVDPAIAASLFFPRIGHA